MKYSLLVVILAFLVISGCSNEPEDALVIGIIKPSMDHLPLDMAFHKEYLNEDDYVLKTFNSGWETNEALISGLIDIAILPFTYIWMDVSQGKDVKIISFLERESDGIIAQPHINSITELNQKKVGVLRSSTLDLFLELFAEQHDLDLDLFYFRTPMDMVAALKTENVDALSFYIPSIYKIGDDYNIIHWYGDDLPDHPCCDLAVNTNNLRNKKNRIKQFMKILDKSCRDIGDNKDTETLVQQNYNLEGELIDLSLQNIKFSMGLEQEGKNIEKKIIEKMVEKGYLKSTVKIEDVYLEIN